MRIEELRIGNWYREYQNTCVSSKGYHQVTFKTFEDIQLRDKLSGMTPIQLTEDILLKCGFKKYGDNCMRLGHLKQMKQTLKKGATGYSSYFMYAGAIFMHIRYLHQLQNLTFALTNEELKINL